MLDFCTYIVRMQRTGGEVGKWMFFVWGVFVFCYIILAKLKLMILLPQPPECRKVKGFDSTLEG